MMTSDTFHTKFINKGEGRHKDRPIRMKHENGKLPKLKPSRK